MLVSTVICLDLTLDWGMSGCCRFAVCFVDQFSFWCFADILYKVFLHFFWIAVVTRACGPQIDMVWTLIRRVTRTGKKKTLFHMCFQICFSDFSVLVLQSPCQDSFGQEAVDTLIKEMEDKRKNVIVILAGYEAWLDSTCFSAVSKWSRKSRHSAVFYNILHPVSFSLTLWYDSWCTPYVSFYPTLCSPRRKRWIASSTQIQASRVAYPSPSVSRSSVAFWKARISWRLAWLADFCWEAVLHQASLSEICMLFVRTRCFKDLALSKGRFGSLFVFILSQILCRMWWKDGVTFKARHMVRIYRIITKSDK